jgi:hypothetical protein
VIKISVFDEIKQSQTPDPAIAERYKDKPLSTSLESYANGYVWVNILIKFDIDGKAEIIRSFTKPAKESSIKAILKPKKELDKLEVDRSIAESKEALF